jgi:hypothetical protein
MTPAAGEYVIVWEFRVRQARNEEFVQKYGPEGAWARFFRGSAGFIRTELVRDVAVDFRYLRWITGSRKKSLTASVNRTWPSTNGWTKNLKV